MLFGYARVSTGEQTLALQEDALKKVLCDRLFTDTASGLAALICTTAVASPPAPLQRCWRGEYGEDASGKYNPADHR
ncbi:MAG: recombinase family protein [Dehalococcoidia bacterium]